LSAVLLCEPVPAWNAAPLAILILLGLLHPQDDRGRKSSMEMLSNWAAGAALFLLVNGWIFVKRNGARTAWSIVSIVLMAALLLMTVMIIDA